MGQHINFPVSLIGAIFVGFSVYEIYMLYASHGWDVVRGTVIERDVRPWGYGWAKRNIWYSFEIDGYTYVSSNFSPGVGARLVVQMPFLPKDFFVAEAFEVGKEVFVRYNANNPRQCAITEGNVVWPTLSLMIGAAMLISALGLG